MHGLLSNKLVSFATYFGKKGWLGALILIWTTTIEYLLALNVLIKCQHVLCRKMQIPYLTYQQTMKVALISGPPSTFVRFFLPFTS